jgi:hypothetical protein
MAYRAAIASSRTGRTPNRTLIATLFQPRGTQGGETDHPERVGLVRGSSFAWESETHETRVGALTPAAMHVAPHDETG